MQDNKYLKHDTLASMGCKLMFLSEKEGIKGYGAYWLLLETLRKVEGFRALMAVLMVLMVLARRVRMKSLFLRRVVEDYDLFIIEDGHFYSPSLCTRLANDVHKVAKVSVKDSSNRLVIKESSLLSTREVEVKENNNNNNNNNNKIAVASASVLDRGWGGPSPMMRHRPPPHIPCGTKRQSCGDDESDDAGDENYRSPSFESSFTEFGRQIHRVSSHRSPSLGDGFTEFHSKRTKAFSD